MRYVLAIAPWIVFSVGAIVDWRLGAAAAALTAITLVAVGWYRRTGWEALILDSAGAVFFTGLAAYALTHPTSPVGAYVKPLSDGWLAFIGWGSLLIRRPFTLGIAKATVARSAWSSRRFYRINAVITAVWAASFTVGPTHQCAHQHCQDSGGTRTRRVAVPNRQTIAQTTASVSSMPPSTSPARASSPRHCPHAAASPGHRAGQA